MLQILFFIIFQSIGTDTAKIQIFSTTANVFILKKVSNLLILRKLCTFAPLTHY